MRWDGTDMGSQRRVLIVTHPQRPQATELARRFAALLAEAGVSALVPAEQAGRLGPGVPVAAEDGVEPVELVVVLGGDGTILWGAELARQSRVPLLGLNMGHVGFLAEAEQNELSEVAQAVVERSYRVERRLAIEVSVQDSAGSVTFSSWALNEASIEKGPNTRMVDLLVGIDGHPLSRWGADGLVLATPTGSTAYAWSAGGPVVWPDVEALLVVPNAAHALFARPLVLAPTSVIRVDLADQRPQEAQVWCDGRRSTIARAGDTVVVRRSPDPVLLARLHSPAFVERLVGKFDLPVHGWRRQDRTGIQ